jgi:hypothetical protein
MAEEAKSPAPQEDKVGPAPEAPASGQAETKPQEAPSEVPEKFKGKSPQEIAKMYVELEGKIGDQSKEIGEAREYQRKMDAVLQAIWSDPNLYNQVDLQIKKISGVDVPDTKPPEVPKAPEKPDEKKDQVPQPDLDTRKAMESQIINDFFRRYGIDQMEPEKRRESQVKIGTALAEMLDPGGKKSYQQIMTEVSLQKLPRFLENAYIIANKDSLTTQAVGKADEGAIGSIPSSGSGVAETLTLSPEEREIAKKQGITEEKYLTRKKEILEATK